MAENKKADIGNLHIAIVIARWNNFVTQRLLDGAQKTLIEKGLAKDKITTIWVPGSFEIPFLKESTCPQEPFIMKMGCGFFN